MRKLSPCASFWRTFPLPKFINRVRPPMATGSRPQIGTPVHGPSALMIVRAILFIIATATGADALPIYSIGRRLPEAVSRAGKL